MSVKTFAEAVKEHITRYTRAFGIEQAEAEEAEFASKTELAAKPSKSEAETIAGEAVKKTELPAATAVATGNIAALSGIPAKGETDEVTLVANQIVLLVGQTVKSQNGPWEVKAGAWVRPTGFVSGSEQYGVFEPVTAGEKHAGSVWVMTNLTKITVDTTATTWVENSAGSGVVIGLKLGPLSVSVGINAGEKQTTGERNTSVGNNALQSNTASITNTAIGYYALQALDGTKAEAEAENNVGNTAIGCVALGELKKGKNETFGENQLRQNSRENTAIGVGAMHRMQTGSGNCAIGHGALEEAKTGYWNNVMGDSAAENSLGNNNTVIGFQALKMSGGKTSFIAALELEGKTKAEAEALAVRTGSENVAIGNFTLFEAFTAKQNVAIGEKALYEMWDGIENTAVGGAAGLVNHRGSGNVFIGCSAGASELGSNKLYIGSTWARHEEPLIKGDFSAKELQFNTTKMGFFKTAPASQEKVAAAATTLLTVEALANSMRTAMIKLGLMKE